MNTKETTRLANIQQQIMPADELGWRIRRIYPIPSAPRFALLVLCVLISGCASDRHAYERAEQQNTLGSWKQFISQYPKSEYLQEAKVKLSTLEKQKEKEEHEKRRAAWDSAVQKKSNLAYWEVWNMSKGKGEFADKAKTSIHDLIANTIRPLIGNDLKNLREDSDFPIWFFSARDLCSALPAGRSQQCDYVYAARVTELQAATQSRPIETHALVTAGLTLSGFHPVTTVTSSANPDSTLSLYSLPGEDWSLRMKYQAAPGTVDTGNALEQGLGSGTFAVEGDGTATLKGLNVTLSINVEKMPYKLEGTCVAIVRNKEVTSVFAFGKARKLLFE